MDIEREEATGGHYKYEVCRRSTWGKQPKSSALLWCLFTQKLRCPVVFSLTTVGNELAHLKQLCLSSVNLRITRMMLMVCFLSLHLGPGREAPGMACPSEGSQGWGHLESFPEDTLLNMEMKLSRAWQILVWLFYDNTLGQGDDPRRGAGELKTVGGTPQTLGKKNFNAPWGKLL